MIADIRKMHVNESAAKIVILNKITIYGQESVIKKVL